MSLLRMVLLPEQSTAFGLAQVHSLQHHDGCATALARCRCAASLLPADF